MHTKGTNDCKEVDSVNNMKNPYINKQTNQYMVFGDTRLHPSLKLLYYRNDSCLTVEYDDDDVI